MIGRHTPHPRVRQPSGQDSPVVRSTTRRPWTYGHASVDEVGCAWSVEAREEPTASPFARERQRLAVPADATKTLRGASLWAEPSVTRARLPSVISLPAPTAAWWSSCQVHPMVAKGAWWRGVEGIGAGQDRSMSVSSPNANSVHITVIMVCPSRVHGGQACAKSVAAQRIGENRIDRTSVRTGPSAHIDRRDRYQSPARIAPDGLETPGRAATPPGAASRLTGPLGSRDGPVRRSSPPGTAAAAAACPGRGRPRSRSPPAWPAHRTCAT